MNETELFVENVKALKGFLYEKASTDFDKMNEDDAVALISLSKVINSGLDMVIAQQKQLDRIENKLDKLLSMAEESLK